MADLMALQKILGVAFKDVALLEQALVHTSYCNENPSLANASNERLEFLGDAVLGLIVAEKLYRDYPDLSEGEMTKLRSLVVRREALCRAAKAMNLGDYLYLGKGEEASGGRSKPANLSRAVEALIAAIFLDRGLVTTRDFVLKWLGEELRRGVGQSVADDYKSKLQEFMQSRQQMTPRYRLAQATGPDHERWFTVEVVVGDAVLGRGSGRSKKVAESEAARSALEQLS